MPLRWTWILWGLQLVLHGVVVAGSFDSDEVCSKKGCREVSFKDTNPEGYYWRRRAGSREVITSVPFNVPADLTKKPAWVWPNSEDEQVRHSPLIDNEKSIYVTTLITVRKFTEHGTMVWSWTAGLDAGQITTSPALDHGVIYILVANRPWLTLTMVALNMATGELVWKRTMPKSTTSPDAHSLLVYNDTILFPSRSDLEVEGMLGNEDQAGNNQVRAVNQSGGGDLWTYTVDGVLWNLLLSTPGDGTLFFSTTCGSVFRISWDGELIWQSGRPPVRKFCGCAGGVLGANGVFYAEFNTLGFMQGGVSAHRASDGKFLWERLFPSHYGGWQYPAVGRLAPDGRMAVVAMMGSVTNVPAFSGENWMPELVRDGLTSLYLNSSLARKLMGIQPLPLQALAMDADTGETIWSIDEEPWDHRAAIGDEEPLKRRSIRAYLDPTGRTDVICLPDTAGIPVLTADGTTYISSSHTGMLAAIVDKDRNGIIDLGTEVSAFYTNQTFLNSPSMAPGMLVAAPCWGPIYVFKDTEA